MAVCLEIENCSYAKSTLRISAAVAYMSNETAGKLKRTAEIEPIYKSELIKSCILAK